MTEQVREIYIVLWTLCQEVERPLRHRYRALRECFERMVSEQMQNVALQATDLSARINYLATQFALEDSVKNAVERYKTVLENYREGKYRREQTFSDEWLDAEGEILVAMCRIKNNGIRIKNEAENYGKKF